MEILDFTEISDEAQAEIIEQADPCEHCGSKDDLVLGIVTSGDDFGEYLVLCSVCQLDLEIEPEQENC